LLLGVEGLGLLGFVATFHRPADWTGLLMLALALPPLLAGWLLVTADGITQKELGRSDA